MKTDELITALASQAEAVDPRAPSRWLAAASIIGVCVAVPIAAWRFGINPELASNARLPMFWCKLAIPLAVAAIAFAAASRLARPGERAGAAAAIGAALARRALGCGGASTSRPRPPASRFALVAGDTALAVRRQRSSHCRCRSWPRVFVALRGLAPTRPIAAGCGRRRARRRRRGDGLRASTAPRWRCRSSPCGTCSAWRSRRRSARCSDGAGCAGRSARSAQARATASQRSSGSRSSSSAALGAAWTIAAAVEDDRVVA